MNNKWGRILDITLTVATIVVPLISGRRQEAKAKEEMVKIIQEEVRKQSTRRHHG